ncbi:MAG: prephenate dehydrogenase [Anaerolineae bacterium]|nr:prephenate dehydrogenase [Anaerolineae bacterium]
MADVKVAILGLERLGTSFGLALKRYMEGKEARHNFTMTGYDERSYNGKYARKIGAIGDFARDAGDAVRGAHIVLLTDAYYRAETTYRLIGPNLMPGAVVMDASPLKRPSIIWAEANLSRDPETAAYMVGFTPVLNPEVLFNANTEVEQARADLFDKGTFILTPAANCPGEAIELASELARIVGAEIHFMDPNEHDGLLAATEGIPAALAVALFQTFLHSQGWDDMRRLTNPSFGLLTNQLRFQHASSLWALLHYNRENTARHLTMLIDTLAEIRDSLQADEEGLAIEALLEQTGEQYNEWEGSRLANRWDKESGSDALPETNMLNQMGGMLFGRRARKKDDDQD